MGRGWQTPSAEPALSQVIETLATLGKAQLPGQLARWLDTLDETGRWALLKLVTSALRVGVSARLAKTAAAALGDKDPHDIELIWPGLRPPYGELFAWLEGRADKPASGDPAPFRPPMLAHAIEAADFAALDPAAYLAEWKWDGIRVQAAAGRDAGGRRLCRLYSRSGEDISAAFPDLVEAVAFEGALDGELLIVRDGRVQSFNVLQQRLNRKTVTARLTADFPAHLRAYDLIFEGEADLRAEPFAARRGRGWTASGSTSTHPARTSWRWRPTSATIRGGSSRAATTWSKPTSTSRCRAGPCSTCRSSARRSASPASRGRTGCTASRLRLS